MRASPRGRSPSRSRRPDHSYASLTRLPPLSRYSLVVAEPGDHADAFSALMSRNLFDQPEDRYFKYYLRNPLGSPHLVLAGRSSSEEFVGMAALIPTRLRSSGDAIRGGIASDFAVDREHRGFGPALQLQRALLAQLGDETDFIFGIPNRAAEPLFHRLGYTDLGRLTRFVKVFQAQVALERYVRTAPLKTLSSAVIDPVLAIVSRERFYRRSLRLTVEKPVRFDERFVRLWQEVANGSLVTGERTPEIMNWRYEIDPARTADRKYGIFAVLDLDDVVVGYVVYFVRNNVRHVVDILVLGSRKGLDALLSEFIIDARRERAAAVSIVYVGAPNSLTRGLRRFGFIERREQPRLMVNVSPKAPHLLRLRQRDSWYFVAGDNDI